MAVSFFSYVWGSCYPDLASLHNTCSRVTFCSSAHSSQTFLLDGQLGSPTSSWGLEIQWDCNRSPDQSEVPLEKMAASMELYSAEALPLADPALLSNIQLFLKQELEDILWVSS